MQRSPLTPSIVVGAAKVLGVGVARLLDETRISIVIRFKLLA